MDNDELLKLLKTLERLAKTLGRRRGLSPEDVEDFAQDTLLKFMNNDYAILRKFRGDSSMPTYLASVVGFYFKDWLNSKWGKYRTARSGDPRSRAISGLVLPVTNTCGGVTRRSDCRAINSRTAPTDPQ